MSVKYFIIFQFFVDTGDFKAIKNRVSELEKADLDRGVVIAALAGKCSIRTKNIEKILKKEINKYW